MAVYRKDQVVKPGMSCPIPRDRYAFRILKQTTGESKSSGNPQTVCECEYIAGPSGEQEIEVDGTKYNIAGVKAKMYITYTEKNIGNVIGLFALLGNPVDEIDTDNLPDTKWLEGIVFDAVAQAEAQFSRKPPVAGQKVGEIITDASGKPVSRGYNTMIQLLDVLGLSTVVAPAF